MTEEPPWPSLLGQGRTKPPCWRFADSSYRGASSYKEEQQATMTRLHRWAQVLRLTIFDRKTHRVIREVEMFRDADILKVDGPLFDWPEDWPEDAE